MDFLIDFFFFFWSILGSQQYWADGIEIFFLYLLYSTALPAN